MKLEGILPPGDIAAFDQAVAEAKEAGPDKTGQYIAGLAGEVMKTDLFEKLTTGLVVGSEAFDAEPAIELQDGTFSVLIAIGRVDDD